MVTFENELAKIWASAENFFQKSIFPIDDERINDEVVANYRLFEKFVPAQLAQPTLNKPLAKYIDHTALKADCTESAISTLCETALTHDFASVCVNGVWVPFCAQALAGTSVLVCTVVGFPLGASFTELKAIEAFAAAKMGAHEIDMVIDVGALKSQNFVKVYADIKAIVNAVYPKTVKVIIETSLLTRAEKIAACTLAKIAGAHFVKTSTGFSTGGATVEDVALMRAIVGNDLEVKASGGVRDANTALAMIAAGATRIGTSSGVEILNGATSSADY